MVVLKSLSKGCVCVGQRDDIFYDHISADLERSLPNALRSWFVHVSKLSAVPPLSARNPQHKTNLCVNLVPINLASFKSDVS